ncbi:MAG: hydroxymethylbilane synthase [Chloroflexota bacterium]|nr:hydroxymethylbilane synthase [Chloroflexota bacterium]
MKQITIGTRASRLAMTQTEWVSARLREHWPNLKIHIAPIRTRGDRIIDAPLTQIGGDGVFVTEIEHALHEGRIDLAVHSLKDLPTLQPPDLCVFAIGPREDVRDVFVAHPEFGRSHAPSDGGIGLRIGTCSLRRAAQLRALYPQAEFLPLRGNVDTRLRKLDAGEYELIVLAAAGLHRLDLPARLAGRLTYLPLEDMLPAPGQGALALEIRTEPEVQALIAPLVDPLVQATTTAERAFMRWLGAGCYLPVAAYAVIEQEALTLSGRVISLDGRRQVRVTSRVHWTPEVGLEVAEQLGITLAEQALAQGADEIIGMLISGERIQERQGA